MDKLVPKEEFYKQVSQGVSGIANVMGNLGKVVGGAAGAWLEWGQNLLQAIAAAIPQIMSLVAAQQAQGVASTYAAGTGAAASVSAIPIVGPILAIAAVASVLAALASIPKYAEGGLAYGKTLGMFGEYANASTNPEVVAPLSKLLGPDRAGRRHGRTGGLPHRRARLGRGIEQAFASEPKDEMSVFVELLRAYALALNCLSVLAI